MIELLIIFYGGIISKKKNLLIVQPSKSIAPAKHKFIQLEKEYYEDNNPRRNQPIPLRTIKILQHFQSTHGKTENN